MRPRRLHSAVVNEVSLVTEARRETGSAACRRLRAAGKVPAVLYGTGIDPVSVVVDARSLRQALSGPSGLNALLTLEVGGARHLALARQIQRDALRGGFDHVDFLVVNPDVVVGADVPVRLVGEAVELGRADGVVEQQLFSLHVQAKPAAIPTHIEVDISNLNIGDTVRVGDLKLPAGAETDVDEGEPVVSGVAARVEVEEVEEVPEGLEGVPEGEAAEAAGEGEEAPEASGGSAPAAEG